MNTTLKTILLSSLALPFIAFAQTGTTTGTSSVQVSASQTQERQSAECIKIATNIRENAITEARKIYNTAVEKAHDERKKALENATTTEAKKVIKDSYALALKKAQDTRVTSRENAMEKWKIDALACKDTKKSIIEKNKKEMKNFREEKLDEIKSINKDMRRELESNTNKEERKEIREEKREEVKNVKGEAKSRMSDLREKMKSFFFSW